MKPHFQTYMYILNRALVHVPSTLVPCSFDQHVAALWISQRVEVWSDCWCYKPINSLLVPILLRLLFPVNLCIRGNLSLSQWKFSYYSTKLHSYKGVYKSVSRGNSYETIAMFTSCTTKLRPLWKIPLFTEQWRVLQHLVTQFALYVKSKWDHIHISTLTAIWWATNRCDNNGLKASHNLKEILLFKSCIRACFWWTHTHRKS